MVKLTNILLIDDDEITNFIDSDLIKELDITEMVSIVEGGAAALEYIEKAIHNQSKGISEDGIAIPQIIFLDMNMPEMDGCEFLGKFNSINITDSHLTPTIIMLSTSFIKNEIERAFKISTFVKGYFEKPLTNEIVMDIYERHLKENNC